MKNFFKLMLLLLLAIPFQACSDDDEAAIANLEVTTYNIAGVWKLHNWSGSAESLPEVYIEFSRKENRFKIFQTYNSMYPEIKTGTYSVEKDYYKGTIMSGVYDHDNGKWNNKYVIKTFTDTVLELVAGKETQTFVRVDKVPDYIINNIPEMEEVKN